MAGEYTEAELLNDIAEMDCRDERAPTTSKQDSRTAEVGVKVLEKKIKLIRVAADSALGKYMRASDEQRVDIESQVNKATEDALEALRGVTEREDSVIARLLAVTRTASVEELWNACSKAFGSREIMDNLCEWERCPEEEIENKWKEREAHRRELTRQNRSLQQRIKELEETVRMLKEQQQQSHAVETETKEQEGVWEDYNTPRPGEWDRLSVAERFQVTRPNGEFFQRSLRSSGNLRQDAPVHSRRPSSTRHSRSSRGAKDQESSGQSEGETESSSEPERRVRKVPRDRGIEMYFKQMAIPPVDPFAADRGQSLTSFIASFKLKYPSRHWSDAELRVLFRDLLRGKARKQYDSMPGEKREAPFEDMLDYFRERVEGGRQARQLMAYADLQRLRLGEGQSVTDFCISLESLTKMAYPDVAEEAISTLMAHKLYDQFASSADSYHIMEAMEAPEGGAAMTYTRVKEAALRCERNRAHRKRYCGDDVDNHRRVEMKQQRNHQRKWSRTRRTSKSVAETMEPRTEKAEERKQDSEPRGPRCFICQRRGHIAKDCGKATTSQGMDVSQNTHPKESIAKRHSSAISAIVQKVACQCIKSKGREDTKNRTPLYGGKATVTVYLWGRRPVEALLDSGSEISIIPARMLQKAMDDGEDVDALTRRIPKDKSRRIVDASGRPMRFAAARTAAGNQRT
ncbi:hypothetical protein Y032_0057g2817 [Ancylostoma ceylanicum]|uniref:CCHC-type domain-containing protein n=1 Tax=Ancylostoma ceylanicum TaxID=53326 RepID=A0A016U5S7_9BILA|nr:hypothetical protein Y032_0057g2817 [Ancylostoma ceylanicum]